MQFAYGAALRPNLGYCATHRFHGCWQEEMSIPVRCRRRAYRLATCRRCTEAADCNRVAHSELLLPLQDLGACLHSSKGTRQAAGAAGGPGASLKALIAVQSELLKSKHGVESKGANRVARAAQ